jgi:Ca2+-binding EF-hand superfamily protein
MDRSQEGAIRRGDFVWALSALGASVEFQRVIRRARLSAYFKSTAREISFEEFSQRIFPNASPSDTQKMHRWICMRKAQRVLTSEDFIEQEDKLQEVFALLEEERGCGSLQLVDLIRAQLLSKAEILDIVPETQGPEINFEEFCRLMRPSLELKAGLSINEFKSFCKDGIHSKLEALHQENLISAVLARTPKCDASAKRSPRTQLCGTDSDQSSMSESTMAPSGSSIVSDM